MRRLSLKSTDFGVDPKLSIEGPCPMRRLSLKSTDFGVDPKKDALKQTPMVDQ